MRATMNLNTAATQLMQGMSKVRVKLEGGSLYIKPTDRVCGKNLPKGEKLLKLSKRTNTAVKFSLRGFDGAQFIFIGASVGLSRAGHGWYLLENSTEGEAAIRVCKA